MDCTSFFTSPSVGFCPNARSTSPTWVTCNKAGCNFLTGSYAANTGHLAECLFQREHIRVGFYLTGFVLAERPGGEPTSSEDKGDWGRIYTAFFAPINLSKTEGILEIFAGYRRFIHTCLGSEFQRLKSSKHRQGPRLTLGSQTGERTPKKVIFQLRRPVV